MKWFSEKLGGAKQAMNDSLFVTWGLYRLVRRTCPRWVDLLLALVVVGCALSYMRWQLFGRWVQAISRGESGDIVVPTILLLSALAAWNLVGQGTKTVTTIIDKTTNKFFMSFLTSIRIASGLPSLLGKSRKEDILARAEEGEYHMRIFIPNMVVIVNLLLTALVGFGIIFAYMPGIGLLLVAASLLTLSIELWAALELSKAESDTWPELSESTTTKNQFRTPEAMKAVLCFGLARPLLRHLDSLAGRIYDPQLSLVWKRLPWKLFSAAVLMSVYLYALFAIAHSFETQGSVAQVSFLALTLINAGLTSAQIVEAAAKQVQGADRMIDFLKYYFGKDQSLPLQAQLLPTPNLGTKYDINIRNLTFGYYESKPVIEGLSLEIPEDETVFVVGSNGVGKSTLFNAITNLYPVKSGMVSVGGVDIVDVPGDELRQVVRHVPQGTLSLNYTVRETFQFMADKSAGYTEEQMWEALRLACLEDKVRSFSQGLDEPLARYRSASVDFSGGQRKKHNLAMFFFAVLTGKTRVVILDEPFIGIDPESASKIMEACRNLKCTVIVSMHEVERIPDDGKVIFLSRPDGKLIATQGTHADLLRDNAEYRRYCAKDEAASAHSGRDLLVAR